MTYTIDQMANAAAVNLSLADEVAHLASGRTWQLLDGGAGIAARWQRRS
jgi:hypothetical protein